MDIKTIERLIESGVTQDAAWLAGFAAGIRREALEEAAKACEANAGESYGRWAKPLNWQQAAKYCAADIRSLATLPPQPAPDDRPEHER